MVGTRRLELLTSTVSMQAGKEYQGLRGIGSRPKSLILAAKIKVVDRVWIGCGSEFPPSGWRCEDREDEGWAHASGAQSRARGGSGHGRGVGGHATRRR